MGKKLPEKKKEVESVDLKSVTVAVGSYEGGLLVYVIDLVKGFHVPYFTAEDNLVLLISTKKSCPNFPREVLKLSIFQKSTFTLEVRTSSSGYTLLEQK
jgi:hypothetical protein